MSEGYSLKSIIAPCYECSQKGCGAYHDSCEKYQEYRKALHNRGSTIRKNKHMHHILNDIQFSGVDKHKKDLKQRNKYK